MNTIPEEYELGVINNCNRCARHGIWEGISLKVPCIKCTCKLGWKINGIDCNGAYDNKELTDKQLWNVAVESISRGIWTRDHAYQLMPDRIKYRLIPVPRLRKRNADSLDHGIDRLDSNTLTELCRGESLSARNLDNNDKITFVRFERKIVYY